MITENLSTLQIHKLTQEQYNRELGNGNIDANAIYLTPNEVLEIELGGTGATTIEEALKNFNIGTLSDLKTNAKTIVGAINELYDLINS